MTDYEKRKKENTITGKERQYKYKEEKKRKPRNVQQRYIQMKPNSVSRN